MKQLKCEMCGGVDLIKSDGVFVCQNCGTKYSVEEAKKMMVEGTVDVTGSTVKVDISDELKNLYQIARRAKDDNNGESAEKYYDMILVKDPNSWEASFYLVYFRALQCKIAEIQSAAISVQNCIDSVLKLIKDYVKDETEQEKAIQEIALRCTMISTMLYNGAKNHYDGIDYSIKANYTQEFLYRTCAARDIMYILGNNVDILFKDNNNLKKIAVEAWKDGITKHNALMLYFAQKETNKEVILQYAAKIQKYDPSYETPTVNTSACYVATAVYGSYDCPQVWTLRRFRDYKLDTTWYGRAFINLYYAISPTIVKYFGENEWFKKMWRKPLDKMVEKLRAEGVEDTPYEDKIY